MLLNAFSCLALKKVKTVTAESKKVRFANKEVSGDYVTDATAVTSGNVT
jgi:hypothetical protein